MCNTSTATKTQVFEDVLLVEFMYLVFTHMPGESYHRWLGSLLLYLCYVLRTLINSLVCWFWVSQLLWQWLVEWCGLNWPSFWPFYFICSTRKCVQYMLHRVDEGLLLKLRIFIGNKEIPGSNGQPTDFIVIYWYNLIVFSFLHLAAFTIHFLFGAVEYISGWVL